MHFVTLLFVTSIVYVYTPKVEAVTQNSAIEFFKDHAEEDAYITTLGFRSYATHYYGSLTPELLPETDDIDELLNQTHQTDIYLVMIIDDEQKYLKRYPRLKFFYEKNEYVFTVLPKD